MKTSVFISDPSQWPHERLLQLRPSPDDRRVVFGHTDEVLKWDDLDKSLKVIIHREKFGIWFCLHCMVFGEDQVRSAEHLNHCKAGSPE